ncbi:tRNA 2-thiouridine(34) synthase MnmA [Fundidesulfovibrio butyratiphilus]
MKRVAVAVSGGMDSLLALALVREAGFAVTALHAHFLPPDHRDGRGHRLARALDDLCRGLGVDFAVADLSRDFRRLVIEPFARAYLQGGTPNPCVLCNRDMKFGLLADHAARLGADALATGHYARLEGGALGQGLDPAKDQSYFLALVPACALARARFPLSGTRKADVPAALAARNLAPPLPGESQDVCFIPNKDYAAYLEAQGYDLPGPGPIELADGRRVGTHRGLWRHTLGQRRGLGVPWSEPLYAIGKDMVRNVLTVGGKADLAADVCRTRQANFLVDPAHWPETVLARTCFRQRPREATARIEGPDGFRLDFRQPVEKPTPGQLAVVYDAAGRVLAGGIIV